MFTANDRVCRKGTRTPGTVVTIIGNRVRVRWGRTLDGRCNIYGRFKTTELPATNLVHEADAPILAKTRWTPDASAYRPVLVRVDSHGAHPSGGSGLEYGVNAWTFAPEQMKEAVARYDEQVKLYGGKPGVRVVMLQRMECEAVPPGCRKARRFSKWVTLWERKT